MNKMSLRIPLCLAVLMVAMPAALHASGGSSMPPPSVPPQGSTMPEPPRKSPAEEAAELYNSGIQHRDKAVALAKQAAAAPEKERAKLEKKANKEFERAISDYRQASQLN